MLVVQFIIGCFYEIPSLLLLSTTNTDVNHLFSFAATETGLVVMFLCTFVGTVLIQPLALLMSTGFANQLLLDKQLADTDLQGNKSGDYFIERSYDSGNGGDCIMKADECPDLPTT